MPITRTAAPTAPPAPERQTPKGLPGPDPCATFHDFRRDACYEALRSLGF